MTEVDILKRFLAFFCVLSFALSAVAFGTTFTRTVQCVNQNDYVKSAMSNEKDNDDEFEGVRYTVKIGRAVRYLYREGQRWYVDRSP